MSRYRKIDPRIWNDENFCEIEPLERLLWLGLLTHPQMTPMGAGMISIGALDNMIGNADGWCWRCQNNCSEHSAETILQTFTERSMIFCQTVSEYRLIIIKNFLYYNKPDNPNQLLGWIESIEELPRSPLWESLREHLLTLLGNEPEWLFTCLLNPLTNNELKNLKACFWARYPGGKPRSNKPSPKRSRKPSPIPSPIPSPNVTGRAMGNQEQEQEQEQEQDISKESSFVLSTSEIENKCDIPETHNTKTPSKKKHKKQDAKKLSKPPPKRSREGMGEPYGEPSRKPFSEVNAMTFIPDDFAVTQPDREYAKIHNLPSPDDCLLQFVNHNQSQQKVSANWNAEFRKWMATARAFEQNRKNNSGNWGNNATESSDAEFLRKVRNGEITDPDKVQEDDRHGGPMGADAGPVRGYLGTEIRTGPKR